MGFWWRRVDSNHRSHRQQIYSLPPLAARELLHAFGAGDRSRTNNRLITNQLLCLLSYTSAWILMVPRGGLEPPTQGFSVPCSTNWAIGAGCLILIYGNDISRCRKFWRSGRGSNPRPPAWQAGVLTNCTTGPRYYDFGGPSQTRTADQSVMSRPLWPTELKALVPGLSSDLVGVKRFELPTLWSQTRCATKLRYTPLDLSLRRNLQRLL